MRLHQIPALLGRGRRLFQGLSSQIELEIVRTIDTPEVTHIRTGVPGLDGKYARVRVGTVDEAELRLVSLARSSIAATWPARHR